MFDHSWLMHVQSRHDPDRLAPYGLEDAFVEQAAALREDLPDPSWDALDDVLFWTLRLAVEDQQLADVTASVPYLDRLAIGFADPEIDGGDPRFGVIVYVDLPPGTTPGVVPQALRPIEIEDAEPFPVIVRTGRRVRERSTTAPRRAQCTSWAVSRAGAPNPREGWLLPAHAMDPARPQVRFDDGSTGAVVDDFGECMDAVVVSSTGGRPAGSAHVAAADPIVAGRPMTVTDQRGQVHRPTVLDVDTNLGVVRHWRFPIRFSTDWATSAGGDSGALVTTAQQTPAGMHQAAFQPTGANTQVAIALALYQLERYAGLELWR